jgi:hypothetical protein
VSKPLDKFYKHSRTTDKHDSWCKKCSLANNKKYLDTKGRLYSIWRGMRERCNNPNHKNYNRYGQRGITVCARWNNFNNFLQDMATTYQVGLTIERNDNNKGYGPENCKWATRSEQSRNQISTKLNAIKVRVIRRLWEMNYGTQTEIGNLFGISRIHTHRVIHKNKWKDI